MSIHRELSPMDVRTCKQCTRASSLASEARGTIRGRWLDARCMVWHLSWCEEDISSLYYIYFVPVDKLLSQSSFQSASNCPSSPLRLWHDEARVGAQSRELEELAPCYPTSHLPSRRPKVYIMLRTARTIQHLFRPYHPFASSRRTFVNMSNLLKKPVKLALIQLASGKSTPPTQHSNSH